MTYAWGDGSSIIDRILYGNTVENYIAALQKAIQEKKLNWSICSDDTKSDIEKIIEKKVELLVCVPGFKYQFNKNGFNKKISFTLIQWNTQIM